MNVSQQRINGFDNQALQASEIVQEAHITIDFFRRSWPVLKLFGTLFAILVAICVWARANHLLPWQPDIEALAARNDAHERVQKELGESQKDLRAEFKRMDDKLDKVASDVSFMAGYFRGQERRGNASDTEETSPFGKKGNRLGGWGAVSR